MSHHCATPVPLPAVADRIHAIALALDKIPQVPAWLRDELRGAARQCWAACDRQRSALEDLGLQLAQLEELRDQLALEVEDRPSHWSLDISHLRADAQGRYAWDRWQERALAAGLSQELAQLGRSVMREAAQHDWDPVLRGDCGWNDEGRAMLELAQRSPKIAELRWQHLLDTDGERGSWTEQGEWQPFHGRDGDG